MENPLSFDSAGATRQGSVVYIVDLQPAVLATSVYTQLKLFAQRPIEAEHIWQTFTGHATIKILMVPLIKYIG